MNCTGNYLGRCATKGCKHATLKTDSLPADCPEHGSYLVYQVIGNEVASVKCGARCTNAVGPACDCSCGGSNHGAGHAH